MYHFNRKKMRIILISFSLWLCAAAACTAHSEEPYPGHQEASCSIPVCGPDKISMASAGDPGIGKQGVDFFASLLDTHSWPDRWHCGTWSPFHGWLYILSDIVIWFSYFMIPTILFYFVYKKKQEPVPFRFIVFLFIAFILACGLTHLVDAAIFWWPAYRLSALVRMGTAAISLGTVFALIRITPKVLELRSPDMLEETVRERTAALNKLNGLLQEEVNSRQRIEQDLMSLNMQLAEKSERLERINGELVQRESELKISESKVLALNADLEIKVRQRTEELQTINEELEAFTYSVSHDLRAPLRSIQGYSNILSEDYHDLIDDTGKKNLKVIIKNSQYMGQLIDDLLNFSRTSRSKFVKEYFNTGLQVKNVVDELLAQEKDRAISVEISAIESCEADINMLKQVWINLISNAIKYTRREPEARIRIGSTRHGQEIHYYVKDNGVGFDMAYMNKLFGVFQRLHKRDDFEGTGVGLALVKRIVERHGGRIWAEAKVNEGASFIFALPVR
jgi:signal transduction histidine kinase